MSPRKVKPRPYKYHEVFPKAKGFEEAIELRLYETRDIVKRLGVISPNRVFINNYPISNPPAIFNASLLLEGETVRVYARIIVGYYKYVSGIVELELPLEDILSGNINLNYYASRIVISPSTKYDLWGAEDPRTYRVKDTVYMTYTGRTINFFNPAVRIERTLPVTAIREEVDEHKWRKIYVHRLPGELEDEMISNKDAYIVGIGGNKYFFHRPHMIDENYYLLIGKEWKRDVSDEITEISGENNIEVMRPLKQEDKLGWSSPPIYYKKNKVIAFIHGVDRQIGAYRVFAAEIELDGNDVAVTAVTPRYIMEPREPYEVFGDRPYTIFPCGTARLNKEEVLISYGAGDFMIGFGLVKMEDLLGELDKGRIY